MRGAPGLAFSTPLLGLVALAWACGGDAGPDRGRTEAGARASEPPAAAGEARGSRTVATSGEAGPGSAGAEGAEAGGSPEVVVYKTATCGCCSAWIEHLEAAGFPVTAHDEQDLMALKNQLGVPGPVRSCHTALVDGYLVEGHVPADVIRRLLEERPEVAGVAVPGMPIGSPGMEVPGRPADRYDVVTFDGRGRTEVYESR